MNDFILQGFCFTGKAKLRGADVTRGELEAFITANGGHVSPKVNGQVDTLVASRSDTVKANDAISQGKRVCTYDEFFSMAGITHPSDLGRPPQPANPYADRDRAAAEARDRIEAKKEAHRRDALAFDEAAEQIEGWGMF